MPLSTESLMDLYRQMRRIRAFEEKLAELVNAGQLAGFLHLYAGQEAVAVGVCAHLGDRDYVASTHRGQFHEALNLAAIWKLPAVFVAENNGYGEATPMEFVTPVRDLAVRAGAYAMASAIADGMDFFDVHEKAGAAVARARAGEGPTLLECKTYRYYGHYVGDPLTYRTKEEAEAWRQRDALAHFAERTVREGLVEPGNV